MGIASPEGNDNIGRERLGLALLVSCIAVWGVNAVAFKVCTKPTTGAGFDPIFLTGLRFLVVAPCLAGLVALRRSEDLRLQPGDWKRYIVYGFVAIVLAETLQPFALRYTSVANLTLLSHGTISLFTAFWALLLLKQRIAPAGWVGAFIAMAGVGIIASHGSGGAGLHFDRDTLRGDGIALFRSVEHSCYLLALSQWLRKRSAVQVTVYNCVFGALWLLPYVIYRGLSFPWTQVAPLTWAAFAWTVVPTTIYGFVAWNWAMSKVGAVAATNLFYLMPVSAALAAWALLGEPITLGQILGGVVILVGIVLLRWDALTAAGVRLPEWRVRWPWRG